MGENIDMRSGNLNFTLPLLTAQGRTGWKIPVSLTYNSQNWRTDAAVWNLGRDVGYGYGWQLLAGSLTPVWSDYWTVHHYLYTDASGAEYPLDVNNGGVWTSTDSVYVSYDSNAGRLYFNDGSYWVMGCMSAGTEMDAGSIYPTVVEDTNGNQVFFRYQAGQGLSWRDSNTRIAQIEDVRAVGNSLDPGYSTYNFVYDDGPVVPHLVNVLSAISTAESYVFAMGGMQALNDPFGGASFGSTHFLQSVTLPISGLH